MKSRIFSVIALLAMLLVGVCVGRFTANHPMMNQVVETKSSSLMKAPVAESIGKPALSVIVEPKSVMKKMTTSHLYHRAPATAMVAVSEKKTADVSALSSIPETVTPRDSVEERKAVIVERPGNSEVRFPYELGIRTGASDDRPDGMKEVSFEKIRIRYVEPGKAEIRVESDADNVAIVADEAIANGRVCLAKAWSGPDRPWMKVRREYWGTTFPVKIVEATVLGKFSGYVTDWMVTVTEKGYIRTATQAEISMWETAHRRVASN